LNVKDGDADSIEQIKAHVRHIQSDTNFG
jgi:hypothetical protein